MTKKLFHISKSFQSFFIVSPILFHFYNHFEKNFFAKKFLYVFSCFGADNFQCLSSMSDENSHLRFSHNKNNGSYAYDFFFFIKFLNNYFGGIGNFFLISKKYFFANYF